MHLLYLEAWRNLNSFETQLLCSYFLSVPFVSNFRRDKESKRNYSKVRTEWMLKPLGCRATTCASSILLFGIIRKSFNEHHPYLWRTVSWFYSYFIVIAGRYLNDVRIITFEFSTLSCIHDITFSGSIKTINIYEVSYNFVDKLTRCMYICLYERTHTYSIHIQF